MVSQSDCGWTYKGFDMVRISAVAAIFSVASFAAIGAAQATPLTFAQVTETNVANGLTFTNNGTSATLNTTNSAGDAVNFSYQNLGGLPSYLSGSLAAIETINGGAGVTTSMAATSTNFAGSLYDAQGFDSAMTISYKLATPVMSGGMTLSNLLTITIVPNAVGQSGYVLTGQNGGTGGSSTTSVPTTPAATYTETFSSDFLDFALNDPITASYSLSSLNPMMLIGAGGFLNSFTADDTGTFSSALAPLLVPEPGSLAILAAGLAGLAFVSRRRNFVV